MERERLLIIEDDEDIRTQLTYALQDEYTVSVAGDRTRAAAAVQEAPPEIVTLDLGLPPTPDTAEEGLRALEDILAVAPEAKVIIITGNGDRANAVAGDDDDLGLRDRKSTRLNSSHVRISYAVFCLHNK